MVVVSDASDGRGLSSADVAGALVGGVEGVDGVWSRWVATLVSAPIVVVPDSSEPPTKADTDRCPNNSISVTSPMATRNTATALAHPRPPRPGAEERPASRVEPDPPGRGYADGDGPLPRGPSPPGELAAGAAQAVVCLVQGRAVDRGAHGGDHARQGRSDHGSGHTGPRRSHGGRRCGKGTGRTHRGMITTPEVSGEPGQAPISGSWCTGQRRSGDGGRVWVGLGG